jgi:hypothetical protein
MVSSIGQTSHSDAMQNEKAAQTSGGFAFLLLFVLWHPQEAVVHIVRIQIRTLFQPIECLHLAAWRRFRLRRGAAMFIEP